MAEGGETFAWPDHGQALRFAQHSSVAYCKDIPEIYAWNCLRCDFAPALHEGGREEWPPRRHHAPPPPPPPAHFHTDAVVYDVVHNVFGYTGVYDGTPILPTGRRRALVVAFRGTQSSSLKNWISDLRFVRLDLDWPFAPNGTNVTGVKVHSGFFRAYNHTALRPNVTASVAKMLAASEEPAELHVTGHSLGAAIATVCAVDLALVFPKTPVYLWTYGSPRVGNYMFAKYAVGVLQKSTRVTHAHDIVPSVPPTGLGFHHVAREVWQTRLQLPEPPVGPPVQGMTVYEVCDGSGEDPLCHDGQCLLGQCFSVSDHLMYFDKVVLQGGDC